MSTRALYTFIGSEESGSPHSFNVYKHHDGYPSGAAEVLKKTLDSFVWKLPRYESDEFAAGFCAAGKTLGSGGGVRLMPLGDPNTVAMDNCSDIEWRYEIYSHNGVLFVKVFNLDLTFEGTFDAFYKWAMESATVA